MNPDPEQLPQSTSPRSPGGPGSARPILIALAVAVAVSVALVLFGGPDEPVSLAVETKAPASPEATQAPAAPKGRDMNPTRVVRKTDDVATAERPPRATPRRRQDVAVPPVVAAPDAEVEHVIENEPGKEYPRGIDARDYIKALRDAGETEGIAAFPPPGTNPPKAGVIVPDDYQLPEGYERYYQYSDDGKPLEPILLYSPDYEFLDDEGNPVAIPEDRAVPADQVPPDLPVRILDPEKPLDPERLIDRTP